MVLTPPRRAEVPRIKDADAYNNYSPYYDYNMYNDLGNIGDVFTNNEGQTIPNTEGYATKNETIMLDS